MIKTMRFRSLLVIALAFFAVGQSRSASAGFSVYAATSQGDFGILDLTTGQYTSIGSTGVQSIVGMGLIGNTLYGVDNNTAGAGFYSINTSTGAASQTNTLPVSAFGGTTIGNGFYGVTQDPTSSSVFATSASGSYLGSLPLGFPGDGLVAFDSANSTLYFSQYTGNPFTGDELFGLNVLTLALTDVGSLNDGLGNGQQAITGVISGNTLYAIDGNNIYTYTVDSSSVSGLLSSTVISGLNPNGDQVTAVSTVPEPSSVVMVSMAMVVAGIAWSRNRYLSA